MRLRVTRQNDSVDYYSHGKLLLTGEYFVLDGAQALAVPTTFGQHLRVVELSSSESILYWVALNSKNQVWLNLVFDTEDFTCLNADTPEAHRLSSMLITARQLNPKFLTTKQNCAVETKLEFPNEWGLGSSSTLLQNIAAWAQVDSYPLLQQTIGGSGYDLACAKHHSPVLYQLHGDRPETLAIHWKPSFSDKLFFAYLGKKQLSSEGIKYYREKTTDKTHDANELSRITMEVIKCSSINEFEELMNEHETIVGAALRMIKVKDRLFADYWGSVKSLGAWGGDFVMLTNSRSREELSEYLQQKGIDVIFQWNEMVLQ